MPRSFNIGGPPGVGVSGVRAIRPRLYWDGERAHAAPVVGVREDGRLAGDTEGLPVEDVDGIVIPGLVNAHTHLEVGPVPRPAERGFLPWLKGLQAAGGAYTGMDPERFLAPARQRAATMRELGTAVVGDISNTGLTAALVRAAGMTGVCFHERVGIDVPAHPVLDLPDTVPVPHAVYSTHPDWIRRTGKGGTPAGSTDPAHPTGPWSIHIDEDPVEAEFLRGEGPWPGVLKAFGRNLDGFSYPGVSPVAYLDQLGALRPGAILVHCVCTGPDDLDRIAAAHAAICLCIRSNLWIGGRLPDVQGMVDRGIQLVVGTDSLASSPDLDLLAELGALRRAFPWLSPAQLLTMATSAGRAVLEIDETAVEDATTRRAPNPELLLVEGPRTLDALLDGTAWPRRWLAP